MEEYLADPDGHEPAVDAPMKQEPLHDSGSHQPTKSDFAQVLQKMGIRRRDHLSARQCAVIGAPLALVVVYAIAIAPLMNAISPSDDEAVIVYAGFGVLFGGFQVAGTLPLFAFLPPISRLIAGITIAASIAGLILFGGDLVERFDGQNHTEPLHMTLAVPIGTVALQSGFWLLRVFGWRFDRRGRNSSGFTIKHLMITTAIAALACTNANIFSNITRGPELSAVFLGALAAAGLAMLGFLFFLAVHSRLSVITSLGLIVSVVAVVYCAVLIIIHNYVSMVDARSILAGIMMILGYSSVVVSFAFALRATGFRLYRRHRCFGNEPQ